MPRSLVPKASSEPFDYHQPLAVVAGAVAAGIVLDRYCPLAITTWWLVAWGSLIAWALLSRRSWVQLPAIALVIAIAALAGAWHHWWWNLYDARVLARGAMPAGGPVCVEAVALTSPRMTLAPPPHPMEAVPQGDESRLEVVVEEVRNRDHWQTATGRASLVIDGHLLGVRAGDRLQIFGQFMLPEPQPNPGEFDAAAHHRADRRLCLLRCDTPDCINIVQRGANWNWRRWLDAARARANRLLTQRLNEGQSPLASAILLGAREQVDREQTEDFFKTGTIHLFAISGMNVGILAGAWFVLARSSLLPRRPALFVVILLTIAYCLLVDAQPPVVRATVMIVAACCAWMSWRRQSLANTLAAAALIVLALNPADLFRVGPQLSFLAVVSLIWFEYYLAPREPDDPLDRLIARTRPWHVKLAQWCAKFTWKLFVVSAVIWLVSLPLSMYRFHLFSPIALLLNTIIAVPVSLAMLAGFGLLVAEGTITPLAGLFAWVCDGSLWFMQQAVSIGAGWKNGYYFVAGPPLWLVLVFYAGLGLLLVLPRWRPPRRWCVAMLIVWLAMGAVVPFFVRGEVPVVADARDELRCTFISVGHGNAVVLELPNGQTLLYDAGRLGSPERGARSVAAYLWSRQINHLDAVVLSHADIDHYNAMPGLLDRFTVGAVYVSPVMFETEAGAVTALRETIERAGVSVQTIYAGDQLAAGGATKIAVLHPTQRGVIGSDNANSIVLLVEHGGRRILLTGDLESPGLEDVLAEEPIDVDIAAAPHHGSIRSSPKGFAAWCTPEHIVVSGGYGFDSAAAEEAFKEVRINVLHTARDGAIGVSIRADGQYRIRRWRQ